MTMKKVLIMRVGKKRKGKPTPKLEGDKKPIRQTEVEDRELFGESHDTHRCREIK